MNLPKEFILPNTNFSTLSVFDILKHVERARFIDSMDYKHIFPISLELNAGVFTKTGGSVDYPVVNIIQLRDNITTSCTCGNQSRWLCEHQGEVIHAILKEREFKAFFDAGIRLSLLKEFAKPYGLENEPDLDSYFVLKFENSKLSIEPRIKELIPYDEQLLSNKLIPKQVSRFKNLPEETAGKEQILVLGRHRYYTQLSFL